MFNRPPDYNPAHSEFYAREQLAHVANRRDAAPPSNEELAAVIERADVRRVADWLDDLRKNGMTTIGSGNAEILAMRRIIEALSRKTGGEE